MLKEIFGAKRDEVTGEWRKIRNEELHDLAASQVALERSRQGESYRWRNGACMGEREMVIQGSGGGT